MIKFLINIHKFTTSNKTSKNIQVNLLQLKSQFEKHIKSDCKQYEAPLYINDGLLSYTSRLAKTLINCQYEQNQRKDNFLKIKNSLISKKLFTTKSCIDICESLISFKFQGDEQPVIQKMRQFIKQNEKLITKSQSDNFLRSYKYIMTEKAFSTVKFVNIDLKSPLQQKEIIQQKCNNLFTKYKINKYRLQFNDLKKQISFEIYIKNQIKYLKIIFLNQSKQKQQQIQVLSNRIIQQNKKDRINIVINPRNKHQIINNSTLSQKLLIKQNVWSSVKRYHANMSRTFVQKLLNKLKLKLDDGNQYKNYMINIQNIDYLNYILQNSLQIDLKQLFGYTKLNMFHIQFEKILKMKLTLSNINKIKEIQAIDYLACFQSQQLQMYQVITQNQIVSNKILELIDHHPQAKKYNIYTTDKQMISLTKAIIEKIKLNKVVNNNEVERQNKNIQVLINKIALSTLIYGINIETPKINNKKNKFLQTMHPLTHQIIKIQSL